MKKIILSIVLLAGITSQSANAAYWLCLGEKVKASFGQNPRGLYLSVTSYETGMPGGVVSKYVDLSEISFNETGQKSMRDVEGVFTNDGYYEAALNLIDGAFYLGDANGNAIIYDENMDCNYSAGE